MQNIEILWIIGASQGFLLTLFLILKKDRIVNLPLILFVFLTSVELFFQYIYASKLIFQYPHLLYLSEPFSMLGGVLIFLYARNIFAEKFILKFTDLLFLIPFVIYVVYYFPTYLQPAEDKIFDIVVFFDSGISWSENLYEWIAEIVVNLPFLVFSVLVLNKYHIKLKNNFSDISKIRYTVVRNLIIVCIALYCIEIFTIIFAFAGFEIADLLNSILYIFEIIIVYIVGYDALVRKKSETIKYIYVYENKNSETLQSSAIEEFKILKTQQKYEKNVLSEFKIKEISEKITNCIAKEKPYKNPEIRLSDFSNLINEHQNNVSQVLNDIFQKNFYDFINFYRIEDAKLLLKSPEFKNFTITAIGFEVGFNSKSAFYSAFKKFADTTPAQFQKS